MLFGAKQERTWSVSYIPAGKKGDNWSVFNKTGAT